MEKRDRQAKGHYLLAMMIFGSIGLLVRRIPMASLEIAFVRSFLGTAVLGVVLLMKKKPFPLEALKKDGGKILLSGLFLGINWIFLFEAFLRTTITSATLAYYMAPILFLLLTQVFFKTKLTPLKTLTVLLSFLGLYVLSKGEEVTGPLGKDGLLFGLLAAVFYALVMLMNRLMKEVQGLERTFLSLGASFSTLVVYLLFTGGLSSFTLPKDGLLELFLVGILHTGLAYTLYFSSIGKIKAEEVALYSYLDPVFAIVFSMMLLGEPLTRNRILGGLMILSASLIPEMVERKKNLKTRP